MQVHEILNTWVTRDLTNIFVNRTESKETYVNLEYTFFFITVLLHKQNAILLLVSF